MKTLKQSTNKLMTLGCSILLLLATTFILIGINTIITNLF